MFDVQQNILMEKNQSSKKIKKEKQIYDIHKKLKKIAVEKRDQELERLYPEGADAFQEEKFSNKQR